MELVTEYLYLTSPIPSTNIDAKSFFRMKTNGWYRDGRGSQKFQILNKRFKIEGQWYRAMVRFERSPDDETYILNSPIPFVVAKTHTENGVIFVDEKVYHGRKVKHSLGYVEEGLPFELIETVIQDLKQYVVYK